MKEFEGVGEGGVDRRIKDMEMISFESSKMWRTHS